MLSFYDIFRSEAEPISMDLISFPEIPDDILKLPVKDSCDFTEENVAKEYPDLDFRTGLMNIIFDRTPYGNIMLHKTVRAGATTSLVLASIDRKEMCVVVEPTNRIARDTIVEGIQKFRPEAKLVHIKANSNCIKNELMCKEYPDLKSLQFLPLANGCGEECEYYDVCPITEPIREKNIDVLVITADKLAMIMLGHERDKKDGSPSLAKQLYEVISQARNIVFDEAHWMQSHTPAPINMLTMNMAANVIRELKLEDKYAQIIKEGSEEYKSIVYVITKFAELIGSEEVLNSSNKVLAKIKAPDYHEKHIGTKISNPTYHRAGVIEMLEHLVSLCEQAINLIKSDDHRYKYHYVMRDINYGSQWLRL